MVMKTASFHLYYFLNAETTNIATQSAKSHHRGFFSHEEIAIRVKFFSPNSISVFNAIQFKQFISSKYVMEHIHDGKYRREDRA